MSIKTNKILLSSLKVLVAIIFLFPIYIMFVYSFKSASEIAMTGLKFPAYLYFDNFFNAIKTANIGNAMLNSIIAAVFSVVILTIASSMGAYIIVRKNNKFYNIIYYIFLAAIILPFQVIMLPMYIELKNANLINSLFGYAIAISGTQISFSVFITSGFVKTVPIELEEAAFIDGAGKYRTFFQVVFPLMKPIIMTTVILNVLAVWNDLMLALIFLQNQALRTLTLAQYMFISQYSSDLGKAFAAFTLSIIPVAIIYFVLQKYIIKGIVSGAVKG